MSYSRNRSKRKPLAEINVVPYIDVMMVLLIVFMITAPMLTQGVKVNLPQVDSLALPKEQEHVIVSVRADGRYYLSLGGGKQQNTSIPLIKLGKQVAKLVRANPNIDVLINGDTKASYGQVVAAMAALQRVQVHNVGLITEPRSRR